MGKYSPAVEVIRGYLHKAQRDLAKARAEVDVLQIALLEAEMAEDKAKEALSDG